MTNPNNLTPETLALIEALKAEVEAYRLEAECLRAEKDAAVDALHQVISQREAA